MKSGYINLYLTIFLFSVASLSLPAQHKQNTTAGLKAATVYLSGAELSRSGKVQLKKGRNEILFSELENGIDPQSIRATATGAGTILINVVHQVNYLKNTPKSPKMLILEDSLQKLKEQSGSLREEVTVLDHEKNLILANQQLAGEEEGLSIEALIQAADFFRQRLEDIYTQQLQLRRKRTEVGKQISRIEVQLKSMNYQRNQPSNDILVTLEARQSSSVEIELQYYINAAGWRPRYNIRAEEVNKPITLEYRAELYQNTGKDWENIQLTLSTANPQKGGQSPELFPWQLSFRPEWAEYDKIAEYEGQMEEVADDEGSFEKPEKSMTLGKAKEVAYREPTTLADFTTVTEGATNIRFEIEIPQDIPGDGKVQQVAIRKEELEAGYRHFATPKLDKDAFLVAEITGWEKLNLLPGKANVFFDGTFIGESALNPQETGDTLALSLGRDAKVIIQRTQLNDYHRKKVLGSQVERTFAYEIVVRNTKREAIRLQLEDQLPISQDKSITVKQEELSGGKLDEKTGKITWEMELQAQESRKVRLVFTVKYPKKEHISGL